MDVVKPVANTEPQDQHGATVELPFLILGYQMPSDGLPHLPHWHNTAKDVFQAGYESHREPLEVRLRENPDGVARMARLVPVKGVGRTSVIWFGILFTYLQMKDTMSEDEVQDFRRWL